MKSLLGLLVVCLATQFAAAREVQYREAYDGYKLGAPLVVIVSAKWCPHCHALINQLRTSDIQFTVIDKDDCERTYLQANYRNDPLPVVNVWLRTAPDKDDIHIRRIGNIGVGGVRALLKGN